MNEELLLFGGQKYSERKRRRRKSLRNIVFRVEILCLTQIKSLFFYLFLSKDLRTFFLLFKIYSIQCITPLILKNG